MTPTEEAISYFKGRAGFSRLFLKFADRIESLGGVVVKALFLMELKGLNGRDKLKGYDVDCVISYEGK